jgi:hypothetical protein
MWIRRPGGGLGGMMTLWQLITGLAAGVGGPWQASRCTVPVPAPDNSEYRQVCARSVHTSSVTLSEHTITHGQKSWSVLVLACARGLHVAVDTTSLLLTAKFNCATCC